ncbi:acetate uptake transporter [Persicobacter psychrovividus]|uniref:Acetate uptake transporter n=1 Tax=Persicobacter psychrovividus TaxID=387638 RepID=A0ABM7VJI5_9BACT|nr:hypothetical protein PEPS_34210 [Persicobacter psychrovividus]
MKNLESAVNVNMNIANPAPLGLFGFGSTTILLNLHNIGLFDVNSAILGMGIFVGGIAQVIAGMQENKKGNTFGATAFTAYGCFWLSLVAIFVMPAAGIKVNATDHTALGAYLSIWGLFTAGMFGATMKSSKVTQGVFGSLTILFFLLALENFTHISAIGMAAGITGIICGGLAFYDAMAQIINGTYGKTILPLG